MYKPIIDKLVIVFDIKNTEDRKLVAYKLWEYCQQEPGIYSIHQVKNPKDKFKLRYRDNFWLKHPKSGYRIFIQVSPYSPNVRFMRFVMNPDKLGPDGINFFKLKMFELLGPHYLYEDMVTAKKPFTQIDVAVDIVNMKPSDVIYKTTEKEYYSHTYSNQQNQLETIYAAYKPKSGHSDIKIYHKSGEQKVSGLSSKYGEADVTRVEFEVHRPAHNITKLHKLKNHTAKLNVIMPDLVDPPEEPYVWHFFCDSIRQTGVKQALAKLPKTKRKMYADRLKQARNMLWRPDELWRHWPKLLDELGLTNMGFEYCVDNPFVQNNGSSFSFASGG